MPVNLSALLQNLQKKQPPLNGPVMGAPDSGLLGSQAQVDAALDWTPLPAIADAIESVTGWRPGTTPSWVPQSFVESNKASVAADQARQQELQQKYGFTPRDAEIAGGFTDMGITKAEAAGAKGLLGGAGDEAKGLVATVPDVVPPSGITAYHGSPHSFDKFDISKIGTGEGAQAYGHGLYFAESEPVAQSYRDALAPADTKWMEGDRVLIGPEQNAAELLDRTKGDVNQAKAHIKYALRPMKMADQSHLDATEAALDRLNPAVIHVEQSPGSMYQARINAAPEHFLDWDKPLSEQSSQVRETLKRIHPDSYPTGPLGEYYVDMLKSPQGAARLQEAGIPGIRYLDQGSRGAGNIADLHGTQSMLQKAVAKYPNDTLLAERLADTQRQIAEAQKGQTHNYVVFSDKLIDILKKYGLAGLTTALGAGGLAVAAPGQAEASQPPELGR